MGTINYMTGDIITLGLNLDTIEIEEDEIDAMVEEEGYEREDAIETWKEIYEKDIKALCNKWFFSLSHTFNIINLLLYVINRDWFH